MIRLSVNSISIRNIVVVGEIGVGKSSLVNLVIGADRAVTANDVRGTTTKTESYDWTNGGQTFRLWDTPGLSEGLYGTVSPKQAQDAIRSLLTELERGGGVHLLVLCMRGLPRVTKGMKQTYETIVRIRDKTAPDVPLIAVITDLEKRSAVPDILHSMDEWWTANVAALSDYDMLFSGHACITTLPDNCHPKLAGRWKLCRELIRHVIVEGVSPKLARNIVIAGEIGVGKSSLVNLVLNSERAIVAGDISPVKTMTSYYDWENNNETLRLWDVSGLGEGLYGGGHQRPTQDPLRLLFSDLIERGGIHLLIICISGISGVTMATKKTYDFIMRMRDKFSPTTPVVAVITELENRSNTNNAMVSMEGWWAINSGTLSGLHMSFSGHACITTLPDNCHPQLPGRREACRELVRNLIINQSLPLRTAPPKDLHVLLFGETGVGKSSLINLLAGWQIASVSPDGSPCTLDSSEYQFQLGSTTIRLWDTVGLEDPEKSPNGYVGAIEKAVQLIRRLNATGGISLFLFCIRGNRITATTQSNYRLFYEVLGQKEVPIALVVTHLEREIDMEDWWQRNGQTLEKNGIISAGHACITALEGHQRCSESRDILQGLLARFDDQGKFSMPSNAWIGRILKGLDSVVEKKFPKGKDLVRILTKRCDLDPDVARRVAACIDADTESLHRPAHEPQREESKLGAQSQTISVGKQESSVSANEKRVPVKRELHRPTDTYLPDGNILVADDPNLSPNLLKPMLETEWNTSKIIDYLLRVADTLTSTEIDELKSYAAFAGMSGKGGDGRNRFRADELYPPIPIFEQLHLRIIDWSGRSDWEDKSREAELLYNLGLRRHPPMEDIVNLCSQDTDIGKRAFVYFCANLQTVYSDYKPDKYQHVAFIPARKADHLYMEKLGDVFLDNKWEAFELSVIQNGDRENVFEELGVQRHPPSSLLFQLLEANPPRNEEIAHQQFEILSDHISHFAPNELEILSQSPIIPKRISGEEREWLTPVQCYLGKIAKHDLYSKLFHFVDFGPGAIQFLLACGAKNEPSEEDIADYLVENHDQVYKMAGHERFMEVLHDLAAGYIRISDVTLSKMMLNPVLLGTQCEGGERIYSLWEPGDIVVGNDEHAYQLFGDSIVVAPENMSPELEDFYVLLGCKYLTSIVRENSNPSGEKMDWKLRFKYRDLIRPRLCLFLYHHQPPPGTKTPDFSGALSVRVCEHLSVSKTLSTRDTNVTKEQSVWATAENRQGTIKVWISCSAKEDLHELAISLCRALFDEIRRDDVLTLLSILSEKDMEVLRGKGYDVDQVIGTGWVDQRFGSDSVNCISMPIFT